jgi:hypothetical protein
MPLRLNRVRRPWIFVSVDDSPQALWMIIAYFSPRPQGKGENGHTNSGAPGIGNGKIRRNPSDLMEPALHLASKAPAGLIEA